MQGRNDFAFGAFGRLLEYRTEQIPFIAYEGVYVELSYNPSDIFCGQLPQWYLRDAFICRRDILVCGKYLDALGRGQVIADQKGSTGCPVLSNVYIPL